MTTNYDDYYKHIESGDILKDPNNFSIDEICNFLKIAINSQEIVYVDRLCCEIDYDTIFYIRDILDNGILCAIYLCNPFFVESFLGSIYDYDSNYFNVLNDHDLDFVHRIIIESCRNEEPDCYEILVYRFDIDINEYPELRNVVEQRAEENSKYQKFLNYDV